MLGMCHHSSVCPDWDREAARSRERGWFQLPGRLNGAQQRAEQPIEMPIPELVVWDGARRIDLLSTVCFM